MSAYEALMGALHRREGWEGQLIFSRVGSCSVDGRQWTVEGYVGTSGNEPITLQLHFAREIDGMQRHSSCPILTFHRAEVDFMSDGEFLWFKGLHDDLKRRGYKWTSELSFGRLSIDFFVEVHRQREVASELRRLDRLGVWTDPDSAFPPSKAH